MGAPRLAVVGHVEWAEFALVAHVPARGEIAAAPYTWEEPAGGGGVAASQLRKLGGHASLFTVLGADDLGRRAADDLRALGITVHAAFRGTQRRAFVFVDAGGERTITTIGARLDPLGGDPLPWGELADADGVYLTAGDEEAVRAARRARVLVATARVLPLLRRSRVRLDALVASSTDEDERVDAPLDPRPAVTVFTEGAAGGRFVRGDGTVGRFAPAPLPGPVADSYGCGDSFVAGLTFGLAVGLPLEDALGLAARCGAAALTGRGAFENQLTLDDGEREALRNMATSGDPS